MNKANAHANIVVAASDHLILQEDKFRSTITACFDFIEENDALVTLGMKPTRPETGYGYIQSSNSNPKGENEMCKVKAFTEKPDLELAKKFVESGDFLWNSGIFIWNLRTIEASLQEHMPELAQKFSQGENVMGTEKEDAFIQEMFPTCPSISIDYGLMEKAQNVYVMPSDFGWSDLGSWGSLREQVPQDKYGNACIGENIDTYETHWAAHSIRRHISCGQVIAWST